MNKRTQAENLIQHDSTDHRYFMVIQQVVWYECSDPFQFTLWSVIKMIAGDSGTCRVSTPRLADLAMMSTGKVSECREQLLAKGLVVGYQDADTGLWHLSIPDLWERNIAWRQATGDSLTERAALKRQQRETSRAQRRELATETASKTDPLSPHEPPTLSPDESPLSPHETALSPHESPPSPGETKNIPFEGKPIKQNQEEDAKHPAPSTLPTPAEHPAVVAHTRLTDVRLRSAVRKLLAESIPIETRMLEIWETVLIWWLAQGYNPKNLVGLLDVWEQVRSYPGETTETAFQKWLDARERNNGRGIPYEGPSLMQTNSETISLPSEPPELTAEEEMWQQALEQLRLELAPGIFNSWLRGSRSLGYQADGALIVQVKNPLGIEWLTGKLYPTICKVLSWVAEKPLAVAFFAETPSTLKSHPEVTA